MGSPDAVVYPVAVCFTDTGREPVARWARTPFTYSCLVSRSLGAGADQTLLSALVRVQPVTWTPPLMTGLCPAAAFHQTVPAVPPPESAELKVSVLASR
ncbi:hypothetical protein ABZZ74_09390 [Streptomyces sp. NPDC006476]|uniref:hypothetical protein n=1 Tax=Streptomyces sp. NPDC006476 TaxID=3157175 RepID=UPI0033A3EC8E